MREGANPRMADGINDLIKQAAKRGIAMGRVVGSGSMEDPKDIEDAMVRAFLHAIFCSTLRHLSASLSISVLA
jgi:hypothetical protein